ncbi:MAG: hypothetical protein ACR2N5_01670 [Solirubrobacterales bacterium]
MEQSSGDGGQSGIRSELADIAAYWLAIATVFLSNLILWSYSAYYKLVTDDGQLPSGLVASFAGTFLDSVPGLNASWVILGVLEAIAFLVFAASVVAGEFLPNRRKPILLVGLGVSLITFAALMFGSNMTMDFDTVGQLFGYVAATILMIILVLLMPPYRAKRWLAAIGKS